MEQVYVFHGDRRAYTYLHALFCVCMMYIPRSSNACLFIALRGLIIALLVMCMFFLASSVFFKCLFGYVGPCFNFVVLYPFP